MSVVGEGLTEPLLDSASPFWRATFNRCSAEENMVDIAQLVSASDCGSEGRGFESHYPPHANPPLSRRVFCMGWIMGFEEAGPCKAGAKNMPVACFLGRGRIHRIVTASGTDVGTILSFYLGGYGIRRERPDRREGKKVSGGHFLSSGENP